LGGHITEKKIFFDHLVLFLNQPQKLLKIQFSILGYYLIFLGFKKYKNSFQIRMCIMGGTQLWKKLFCILFCHFFGLLVICRAIFGFWGLII